MIKSATFEEVAKSFEEADALRKAEDKKLRADLAAARAEIERLRGALSKVYETGNHEGSIGVWNPEKAIAETLKEGEDAPKNS